MARQDRGRIPQQPMKGFRPGKEPPHLRRQQARQQFGKVDAKQQRLIDMFADKSPEEARSMMRLWRVGLLAGAVVMSVLGALLFSWSVIAAVIAFVLAVVLFIVWMRLRQQREALEAIADAVSGPSGKKTGPKRKR